MSGVLVLAVLSFLAEGVREGGLVVGNKRVRSLGVASCEGLWHASPSRVSYDTTRRGVLLSTPHRVFVPKLTPSNKPKHGHARANPQTKKPLSSFCRKTPVQKPRALFLLQVAFIKKQTNPPREAFVLRGMCQTIS